MLGRESELGLLYAAWRRAAQGAPCLYVISGPTGQGKTRLVQALFERLSADQRSPYWPRFLGDNTRRMDLVPGMDPPEEPIPWLWLAVRCPDPDARNTAALGFRVMDSLRSQIGVHLAGLYARVGSGQRDREAARAALSLLAMVALPGAGGIVSIGSAFLGALDQGLSARDAVKTLRDRFTVSSGSGQSHSVDPDGELLEALRAASTGISTDEYPRLPITLIVDDAHWADSHTLETVDRLVATAQEEAWPLFVVLTTWEDRLGRTRDPHAPRTPLAELVRTAREREALRSGLQVVVQSLPPLESQHQHELVSSLLPGLNRFARRELIDRSRGDLDLLTDYCAELAYDVGWLDEMGDLAVSLEELRSLPSTKEDMARRRLRTAGPEVRELLCLGAAQGIRFFEPTTLAMAATRANLIDRARRLLDEVDTKLGICEVAAHDQLTRVAEFRAYPYFKLSLEAFQRLPGRTDAWVALATALRDGYRTHRWAGLDPADRVEVLDDFVRSVHEADLASAPGWEDVIPATLDLARLQLSVGNLDAADRSAQSVLDQRPLPHDDGQAAQSIRASVAHQRGDRAVEGRLLRAWTDAVPFAERTVDAFVRIGRSHVRDGNSAEAVAVLREAQRQVDWSRRDRARLSLELVRALAYTGDDREALDVVLETEQSCADLLPEDPGLQVAVAMAAYLALHDLDLNDQAEQRSVECRDLFTRAGAREAALMARVNLGDAIWAAGRRAEALACLTDARADAGEWGYPHATSLANACWANVVAVTDPASAVPAYGIAITLAEESGWSYDLLYAQIYRALAVAEAEATGGGELRRLAEEARATGSPYLACVADAYGVMRDVLIGQAPDLARVEQLKREPFPIARIYAAAAACQAGLDSGSAQGLVAELAGVEGIKGRPSFILAALENARTEVQSGDATEFIERFSHDGST